MKRIHLQSATHRRRRRLVLEPLERRELLTAASSSPIVEVQLAFADSAGNHLEQPVVGEPFVLTASVRDVRVDPKGVFAAYVDIAFDPDVVVPTGNLDFDTLFSVARHGSQCVAEGILDEVGAASGSISPLDGEWFELFSVEFTALNSTPTTIATSPADDRVVHDVLVYGLDDPIPHELVFYGDLQLAATPSDSIVMVPPSPNSTCSQAPEPHDRDVELPVPRITDAMEIRLVAPLTSNVQNNAHDYQRLDQMPSNRGQSKFIYETSSQIFAGTSYSYSYDSYESDFQYGTTFGNEGLEVQFWSVLSRFATVAQDDLVTQELLVLPEIAMRGVVGDIFSTTGSSQFATPSAARVLVGEPRTVLASIPNWSAPFSEAAPTIAPAYGDAAKPKPTEVTDNIWTEVGDAPFRPSESRIPVLLVDEVLTRMDDSMD
jgi:hypothetical protein